MNYLRILKNLVWPVRGTTFVVAAVLVIALGILAALGGAVKDTIRTAGSTRADQRSESVVKQETGAAAAHEENANSAGVTRQIDEARAAAAQVERDRAAERSNRTAAPTRAARERYEKTRRQSALDPAPPLTDDQLCAELAKRDIPCR